MFADDMLPYRENLNQQKLLELIGDYSKVAGYKVNIQKEIPFLYASNE